MRLCAIIFTYLNSTRQDEKMTPLTSKRSKKIFRLFAISAYLSQITIANPVGIDAYARGLFPLTRLRKPFEKSSNRSLTLNLFLF